MRSNPIGFATNDVDETEEEETLSFVKNEIKRFHMRNKGGFKSTLILIRDIDIYENYTSVNLVKGDDSAIGYAKVNPNLDEPNVETGLSIATFRAMRRLLAK